jgi:hypothetical protein
MLSSSALSAQGRSFVFRLSRPSVAAWVRVQSTDGVRIIEISVVIFEKMPQLEVVSGVNGISQ